MSESFEFVQQKFHADCAVACLAMFLRVPYEQVVSACRGDELVRNGLAPSRELYIADLFKVQAKRVHASKIDWTRPAVLTLPSLNSGSMQTHAVYWDGRRAWDPNHGRPGKSTYTNQMAQEAAIDGYQALAASPTQGGQDGR